MGEVSISSRSVGKCDVYVRVCVRGGEGRGGGGVNSRQTCILVLH